MTDWQQKQLSEIAVIKTGKKDANHAQKDGKYPFFTCSTKVLKSNTFSFDCEAILVAGNGNVGQSHLYKGKFEAYQRTYVLKDFNQLIDYIYFYLDNYLNQAMISKKSGSTMPYIRKGDLSSFLIPIPPKTTQKQIAQILSTLQSKVELVDKQIKLYEELKKSTMEKLFSEGLYGEKQRETEIGLIPESWKVENLGESAQLKNGINFSKKEKSELNGMLTVDVKNMYSDGLAVYFNNLYRVNKKIKNDYLLEKGDILFVRSSLMKEGVGWPAYFDGYSENVSFCGFLIRSRIITKKINPRFLTYYLRTSKSRNRLIMSSGKVTITNINQEMLKVLEIPIPPIEEQLEIVKCLLEFDKKITYLKNIKKYYQQLFNSMLHKLMNQEIEAENLTI